PRVRTRLAARACGRARPRLAGDPRRGRLRRPDRCGTRSVAADAREHLPPQVQAGRGAGPHQRRRGARRLRRGALDPTRTGEPPGGEPLTAGWAACRFSSMATPTPGKRKLLPRAERAASILRAASRTFARGGYAETSMDDIAAEAGVSKLILYRHFNSKHDLYRTVLDEVRSRLTALEHRPATL